MSHAVLFYCSRVSCPVSPSPSLETQSYTGLKSHGSSDRRRLICTSGTRPQPWAPEETNHLRLQGARPDPSKASHDCPYGSGSVGVGGVGWGGQPRCSHAVETAPLLHAHGQTALSPLALRCSVFSGAPGVAAKVHGYAVVERPSRGVRRR